MATCQAGDRTISFLRLLFDRDIQAVTCTNLLAGVFLLILLSACNGSPDSDASSGLPSRDAASTQFPNAAKGPITTGEITYFTTRIGARMNPLTDTQRACVLRTSQDMAQQAGDPDMSKPAVMEFLSADNWSGLGHFGKRLILAQLLVTKAAQACLLHPSGSIEAFSSQPRSPDSGRSDEVA